MKTITFDEAKWQLVQTKKLEHAKQQAKLAADCIVGFAKDNPGRMCGWLDDACTAADIAASDLSSMLAAAPQPEPINARLLEALKNDAFAVSFQTLGQYRAALIKLAAEQQQPDVSNQMEIPQQYRGWKRWEDK